MGISAPKRRFLLPTYCDSPLSAERDVIPPATLFIGRGNKYAIRGTSCLLRVCKEREACQKSAGRLKVSCGALWQN